MPRDPSCSLCPLHERANHICLWGERQGSGSIRILLLGENPGWNEDQQGRPFVGAAGDLLNESLRAAGLTADDIVSYFTNVTKCTKGQGTIPSGAAKACAHFLEEEIAEFKPQFILAMGNEAIQRLIGRGKVTEIEGQELWSDKYHCWIMPIRHPAAILRTEGGKPAWLLVFHRFEKLIRGQIKERPPVKVRILTPREAWKLVQSLDTHPPQLFTYDFETSGLDWWARDFKARTISYSFDRERSLVVPLEHPEAIWEDQDALHSWLFAMRRAMTRRDIARAPHNCLFDDQVWWRIATYQPYVTHDTIVEVALTDENQPKGLKWQGMARLGWPNWGLDHPEADRPLEELAFYNGCDSAATYALHVDHLWPLLQADPELLAYYQKCAMPTARALERMMHRGVHVDMDTLNDHLAQAMLDMKAAATEIPVENPGSPQQIAQWLYEIEKLPITYRTPTGAPSTDEEAINLLAQRFPQAKKVLAYRKPAKNVSTYFLPTAKIVGLSVGGRAHHEYNHIRVETGRLSGSFHTTPRDPFVRAIYSAPPGWSLINADSSQVEARLAAWRAAGCPQDWVNLSPGSSTLLRLFLNGTDPYVWMAARALRKSEAEVTSDERQRMGKVPTLAMIYRVGWKGFQEYAWKEFEFVYTDEEAKYLYYTFHRLFPEIGQWHRWEEKVLRSRGWTRSLVGRKRRLPEAMSVGSGAYHAVNSGINMPIQSLASELTQAAFILLDTRLDESEAKLVGQAHDNLLVETRDDKVPEVAERVKYYMENSHFALQSLGLSLPPGLIKVEVAIGPYGLGVSLDTWLTQRPSLTSTFASV